MDNEVHVITSVSVAAGRHRAGSACDDYRLLPGAVLYARRCCQPTICRSANNRSLGGKRGGRGNRCHWSAGAGTENAFFVRHFGRGIVTYLRAALSPPSPTAPPPIALSAHTRMIVVPGRSTPSAPISRRVYIIFVFFFLSFSRLHVSLAPVATTANN